MMNRLKLRPVVKGALTFVPGMTRLLPERGGETLSPAYCYGVWMKHLALLWANGLRAIPQTMAELGPGDSLGTGLAAMLCGVNHYRGLDVVEHSSIEANLRVFDELVELFRQRAPRPVKGWPDFDAHLDMRRFPSHILTDAHLAVTLAPARLARLRQIIADPAAGGSDMSIRYMAPWYAEDAIERESVDLIISHAVLAEVVDLDQTYAALHAWLKPEGWMSQQVGFEFPGINGDWNGYWGVSDFVWEIIKGRRPFIQNRQPRSTHLNLLRKMGFNLVAVLENMDGRGLSRAQLAPSWKHLTDHDLNCAGIFVLARKA